VKPDIKFKFGEWLPDQPDLDNPGLTEAMNCRWVNGSYQPYIPLVTSGTALPGTIQRAMRARGSGTVNTAGEIYVGLSNDITGNRLYVKPPAAGSFSDVTPGSSLVEDERISIIQYNEYVIAVSAGSNPQYRMLGQPTSTLFAKLTGAYGDAPSARCAGVVNQFVVLGAVTTAPYAIQWSGINAPLDWPTPNSAQAIAEQSGLQYLDSSLGSVLGITQGDQWGLILMEGGIVRMTYVGGQVVFQFDTIWKSPGPGQNGWVRIGGKIYFWCAAGFFACDGVNVTPLGEGKIDRYYLNKLANNSTLGIHAGVDYINKLIYWTLPTSGIAGDTSLEVLIYNYAENRFTHAADVIRLFVDEEESTMTNYSGPMIFGNDSKLGQLTGTPGVATFTTAEAEFFPGKGAIVTAVTPQVTGTSSVTVALGHRRKQSDSVTYTPAVAPDAFTGDSNFFVDDRYHRAQVAITGNFTQAMGGSFDAQASSAF